MGGWYVNGASSFLLATQAAELDNWMRDGPVDNADNDLWGMLNTGGDFFYYKKNSFGCHMLKLCWGDESGSGDTGGLGGCH